MTLSLSTHLSQSSLGEWAEICMSIRSQSNSTGCNLVLCSATVTRQAGKCGFSVYGGWTGDAGITHEHGIATQPGEQDGAQECTSVFSSSNLPTYSFYCTQTDLFMPQTFLWIISMVLRGSHLTSLDLNFLHSTFWRGDSRIVDYPWSPCQPWNFKHPACLPFSLCLNDPCFCIFKESSPH